VGRARAFTRSKPWFKTGHQNLPLPDPSPSGLQRIAPVATVPPLRAGVPGAAPQLISVVGAGLLRAMVRGPARRTARWWAAAVAVAVLLPLVLVWQPGWGTPLLMAAVLLWQLLSTRLATLAVLELVPLHAAVAALPVAPPQWQLWRELISVLPVLLALALLTVVLLAFFPAAVGAAMATPALQRVGPTWRPLVWCALVAVALLGNAALNRHATLRPEHRSGYWLFVLVLQLALASEVLV
jgi:hypothetical protein